MLRINGEKVYQHEFIRDINDAVIFTTSECKVCMMPLTFRVKVCFDIDGSWDNIEEIDICGPCLIDAGLYMDDEELMKETNVK